MKFLNRHIAAIIAMVFLSVGAHGQRTALDKIIAKVDNEIILMSDLEKTYLDVVSRGAPDTKDTKCQILASLVSTKMLVVKAGIDSVIVLDVEVDGQLEQRIQYFLSQTGGNVNALEEVYGKTIGQLRDEMRIQMKEQLTAQRMSATITENVEITPAEVKKFFNRIPPDSLPFYSEEVEVSQIVRIPKIGKVEKAAARQKLFDIKNRILAGEDFAELAKEFSQDPASARDGGELPGYFSRGQLAPEYEAASFKMKPGDISDPVETQFGLHLIELLHRRGNEYKSRHILLMPLSSDLDSDLSKRELDSIRTLIMADTSSFEKIAKDFSEDKISAPSGGFLLDNAGSTKIAVDQLDHSVYFMTDTMQVGQISPPVEYRMDDGKDAVRIIYFKSKTKAHQANLVDDWQKIHNAALGEKKAKAEQVWFEKSKHDVFVYIDDVYKSCQIMN